MSLKYIGKPQAQQRPRHRVVKPKDGRVFSQTYEQAESRDFKAVMHLLGQKVLAEAGEKPLEGAVSLFVRVYVAVPNGVSKKKREEMLKGDVYPTKKPDVDNLLKAVMDALNGVWYKDDKQVTLTTVCKVYDEKDWMQVDCWDMTKSGVIHEE